MNTVTETHHAQVTQFLSQSPLKAFIGGEWVSAVDRATLTTCDPGLGTPLAEVPAMGQADVDRAVQAATRAFRSSGWAEMAPNERGALLHRLADEVERHKPVLARIEASDAGKILAQAEGDVQNFVDTLRYFVEMSLHVQRRTPLAVKGHEATTVRLPWGPCRWAINLMPPRKWGRSSTPSNATASSGISNEVVPTEPACCWKGARRPSRAKTDST